MKFDLGYKENFPNIGAQLINDGEVLLTFQSYPQSAMMAVPLNVAVDFAKHILDMQKQMEADCLLEDHMELIKDNADLRHKLYTVSSLLREASGRISYGNWSKEFRTNVEKALDAADPKIQQSRTFTDTVTDDDFLHMIDESNFTQERE